VQYPFKCDDRINWWAIRHVFLLLYNPHAFTYRAQAGNHSKDKYFFKQAVWQSKVIKALS